MVDPAAPTFPPEVVEAITRHMNDDHAEDNLRICRALGAHPDATAARLTGLDGDGMDFSVSTTGGDATDRILWPERITERAEVRVAVVRLHDEACRLLGVTPPAHDS
ncbi:MAG: DUF2470 domain-containing protein [Acidimicrobiales bacterium]|nr:DUF2470 domain-containing protein [Acidimicrobiales bacterium]